MSTYGQFVDITTNFYGQGQTVPNFAQTTADRVLDVYLDQYDATLNKHFTLQPMNLNVKANGNNQLVWSLPSSTMHIKAQENNMLQYRINSPNPFIFPSGPVPNLFYIVTQYYPTDSNNYRGFDVKQPLKMINPNNSTNNIVNVFYSRNRKYKSRQNGSNNMILYPVTSPSDMTPVSNITTITQQTNLSTNWIDWTTLNSRLDYVLYRCGDGRVEQNTQFFNGRFSEQCDFNAAGQSIGPNGQILPNGGSCNRQTCQITQAPTQPTCADLSFTRTPTGSPLTTPQSVQYNAQLINNQSLLSIQSFSFNGSVNSSFPNPTTIMPQQNQSYTTPGTYTTTVRIINRTNPNLFADCSDTIQITEAPQAPTCELIATNATPNPAVLQNGSVQVTFTATTPSPFAFTRFRIQNTSIDAPIFPNVQTFSRQITLTTPGNQTGIITLINRDLPNQSVDCPIPVIVQNTPPRCGDGIVNPGEQCDDGNTNNNDGCSSTCTLEKPVCLPNTLTRSPTTANLPLNTAVTFNGVLPSTWTRFGDFDIINVTPPFVRSRAIAPFSASYTFTTPGSYTGRVRVFNNIPANQVSPAFQDNRPSEICQIPVIIDAPIPQVCTLEAYNAQDQKNYIVREDRRNDRSYDRYRIINNLGANPPRYVKLMLTTPAGETQIQFVNVPAGQNTMTFEGLLRSLSFLQRDNIKGNPLNFYVMRNNNNPNNANDRFLPPTAQGQQACNAILPVQPEGDIMLIEGQASKTYTPDAIPAQIPYSCRGRYGDSFDVYFRINNGSPSPRQQIASIGTPSPSSPAITQFTLNGTLPSAIRNALTPGNTYEFRCDTRSPRISSLRADPDVRDLAYTQIAKIIIGAAQTCQLRYAPVPTMVGDNLLVNCSTNTPGLIAAGYRPAGSTVRQYRDISARGTGMFANVGPQGVAEVGCFTRQGTSTNPTYTPIPNCQQQIPITGPSCTQFPRTSGNRASFGPGERFRIDCFAQNVANPRIVIQRTGSTMPTNAPLAIFNLLPSTPGFNTNPVGFSGFSFEIPGGLPEIALGLGNLTEGSFYEAVCMDGNTPLQVQTSIVPPAYSTCRTTFSYLEQPVCLGLEPSKQYVSYTSSPGGTENVFDVTAMLGGNLSVGGMPWTQYVATIKLFIQGTDIEVATTGTPGPGINNVFFRNIRVDEKLVAAVGSRNLIANPSPIELKFELRYFDAQGNEVNAKPLANGNCTNFVTVVPECTESSSPAMINGSLVIPRGSTTSIPMFFTGRYSTSLTSIFPSPLAPLLVTISTNPSDTPNVYQTLISSNLYSVTSSSLGSLPIGTYLVTGRLDSNLLGSGYTPTIPGYSHFENLRTCPAIPVQIVDPGAILVNKRQRNNTANNPLGQNSYTGGVIGFASGDTVSYQITVQNTGQTAVSNATITDIMPDTVQFIAQINTCAATFDQAAMRRTIPTLAAGASCTITINARVIAEYPAGRPGADYCAYMPRNIVEYTDGQGGSGTTFVDAKVDQPILAITKRFLSGATAIGQQGIYTLTITNTDIITGRNLTVRDNLPYGFSHVSSTPVATVTPTNQLTRIIPSLAPGASTVITGVYSIILDDTLSGSVLINTGSVMLTCQPPVTGTDTLTILPRPQGALNVTKRQRNVTLGGGFTDQPITIRTGDIVVYELSYTNNGVAIIPSFTLTDLINTTSFGIGAQSSTGHPLTFTPPLTRNGTNLPIGSGGIIILTGTINQIVGNSLVNTFRGTDDRGNSDEATVVAYPSQLTLDKQQRTTGTVFGDGVVEVGVGQQLIYRLTYSNFGLNTITGAVLTDTLPAGFVPSTTDGGVYNALTNTIVRNIGTLTPGQQGFVTVTGTITVANNSFVNTGILVTAEQTLTDTVVAQGPYTMEFVKQQRNVSSGTDFTSGNIIVAQGQTIEYRLRIRNPGNSIVTTNLLDSLPLGFTPQSRSDTLGGAGTDFSQAGPGGLDYPFNRNRTYTVLPGQEVFVTIRGTIDTRGSTIVSFTNNATLCFTVDGRTTQSCIERDVTAGIPPFVITKTINSVNPTQGQRVTYKVQRKNITDRRIFIYTVRDLLPPTLQYVPNTAKRSLTNPAGAIISEGVLPDVGGADQFVRGCGLGTNGRLNALLNICPMEVGNNTAIITFDAIVQ